VPPAQIVPKLFLGAKRPRNCVDHQTLSRAEVQQRVDLYVYPNHICAFMESYSANFTFYLLLHFYLFIYIRII